MALPQTIEEKFAAASFAGGSARPVVAKDASGLVTMYDDFVFDAMDPNGYASGALPATNAAIPTTGVLNLARDIAPALSRASGVVAAAPRDTSKLPLFTGKGWQFLSGTYDLLKITKTGIADSRVLEPTLEGFVSNLVMAYFKVTAQVSNSSPFYVGQAAGLPYGGFRFINASGLMVPEPGGPGGWLSASLSTWYQVAVHAVYTPASDQVALRYYLNGALAGTNTITTATEEGSSNGGAGAGIGGAYGASVMTGEVGRVRRVMNPTVGGSPAFTNTQLDALVAADYAYKMPLLA